jgi:hypothetical protein
LGVDSRNTIQKGNGARQGNILMELIMKVDSTSVAHGHINTTGSQKLQ